MSEHTHTYTHTHEHDGHEHEHEHSYTHDHECEGPHDHEQHEHHHEHGALDSPEKLKALIDHMHQHNVHHTEELHGVAHALADQGKGELSEKVHEAMRFYDQGNDLLAEVLKKL